MKRKGMLIGTLVMSLGSLAVDQIFLKDAGPASASADTLMQIGGAALTGNASATPTAPKRDAGDRDQVRGLVERLGGDSLPQPGSLDAFEMPAWLSPPAAATADDDASGTPASSTELTLRAISTGRRTSVAVIGSLVLREGETRDGVTLIRVEGSTALVRYGGREIELRLSR